MRGLLILTLLLLTVPLVGCIGGEEGALDASGEADPGAVPSVFPGDYRMDGDFSVPQEEGELVALPAEEITLSSELDGADIDLTIWRPETADGQQVPVIIQASPYYSDSAAVAGVGELMIDHIVPHGYAYVQLAIRSTGNSGGCDDFRGPKMTADMSQAIDHLVEQAWSTEAVSLIGISYVGTTPWYAAGSGNPHVETIVPISGSTNAWEVYNRNGTPEVRSAIIVPNYGATAAANQQRSPEHKVENFACTEVYQGWANGVVSGATGERVDDAWWDTRNAKPIVEANYEGSIFLVHGLEDWNVDPAVALPWADQLNASGLEVKQLLGQWTHAYPDSYCTAEGSALQDTCRWDWAEILLRWFDKELKGLDVETGPAVQVQDNQMRWRDEAHWPPRDAEKLTLGLQPDGTLSTEAPTGSAEVTLAVPTEDRAEYRLGPLDAPLHISGLPTPHITVRAEGPGGTIGAFLYDEAPDGELTRIGWTAMNLRYADGGEDPSQVLPGQQLLAKLQIQPMDAYLEAGHTLVLALAIDTPSDRILPPPATPVTVLTGQDVASTLTLPVIERGPAAFFEPPMPTGQDGNGTAAR